MQFTFLGTSSGVPTLNRNVSGLAIRSSDRKNWCLVDCGEASQHQLLKCSYSLAKLAAVFITHVHGDHSFGLPGLLASASMGERQKPLVIVAPLPLKEFIQTAIRTTQMRLPYEIEFIDVAQMNTPLEVAGLSVRPVTLSHRVESYGYCFSREVDKVQLKTHLLQQHCKPGPQWGQLQNGQDVVLEDGTVLKSADFVERIKTSKSVLVCGDNDTPQCMEALPVPDAIVHEATYDEATLLKVGTAHGHSSAERIARYAQQTGVNNLVLTHFSPRYHGSGKNREKEQDAMSLLAREARSIYKNTLYLAKDFDTYSLDQQGKLILDSTRREQ